MQKTQGYLAGQLLVAMPQMQDDRFTRAVVYVCAHSAEGGMGLVINQLFDGLTFAELLEQLNIPCHPDHTNVPVHCGGPVEIGRGFVLHSTDYMHDSSMLVGDNIALTATIDVLRAIANGHGPSRYVLALGYAGWSAGQLESEIRDNSWLNVPAAADLLFRTDLPNKWEAALNTLGIEAAALSRDAGHA